MRLWVACLWSADILHAAAADAPPGAHLFQKVVPREKLQVHFSRSSGAGGQNVNKVNTKAEIRFVIESADWLPAEVRKRLASMNRSNVTKAGEFFVISQRHRT